MNWHLFTAFLLITTVLILVPGPIVTLVIATSASKGLRAGLVTVAGTSSGNAVLLAVIALGLGWILTHALTWFDMLRFAGAAYLIWLGIQAWRGAGGAGGAERAGLFLAWLLGGAVEPEDHRVLHRVPAAVRRSEPPGRAAACDDVPGFGAARGAGRLRLGHSGWPRARLAHAARARQAARPHLRPHLDRRRDLVVAGAAAGVRK
jgi:hypothetical protein